jgi:hypothetical protein
MKQIHMCGLPFAMLMIVLIGRDIKSQAYIMPKVGIPIMGVTFWLGSLAFEVRLHVRSYGCYVIRGNEAVPIIRLLCHKTE